MGYLEIQIFVIIFLYTKRIPHLLALFSIMLSERKCKGKSVLVMLSYSQKREQSIISLSFAECSAAR